MAACVSSTFKPWSNRACKPLYADYCARLMSTPSSDHNNLYAVYCCACDFTVNLPLKTPESSIHPSLINTVIKHDTNGCEAIVTLADQKVIPQIYLTMLIIQWNTSCQILQQMSWSCSAMVEYITYSLKSYQGFLYSKREATNIPSNKKYMGRSWSALVEYVTYSFNSYQWFLYRMRELLTSKAGPRFPVLLIYASDSCSLSEVRSYISVNILSPKGLFY